MTLLLTQETFTQGLSQVANSKDLRTYLVRYGVPGNALTSTPSCPWHAKILDIVASLSKEPYHFRERILNANGPDNVVLSESAADSFQHLDAEIAFLLSFNPDAFWDQVNVNAPQHVFVFFEELHTVLEEDPNYGALVPAFLTYYGETHKLDLLILSAFIWGMPWARLMKQGEALQKYMPLLHDAQAHTLMQPKLSSFWYYLKRFNAEYAPDGNRLAFQVLKEYAFDLPGELALVAEG